MKKEEEYYGLGAVSRFLPTLPALRYLNCCRAAGWHECNPSYHMTYKKGVTVTLLFLTMGGTGRIKSGDNCWELSEGDIAIVPPGVPVEYATASGSGKSFWEFYWLNLDGDFVNETAKKLWEDEQVVHKCCNFSFFMQVFRWLLESDIPENTRELEQSLKIQELFHELMSEILSESTRHSASSGSTAEQILKYIQNHYTRKLSLEELGQKFFLSKNQIIRIIRKRTGYTPYEYLKLYRLLKACELLQGTMMSVSEVGNCVGYVNNSHFTAQFREVYGMTPTEYREMESASLSVDTLQKPFGNFS